MFKALSLSETVIRGSQQCYKLSNNNITLLLTKYGLNIASLTLNNDENQLNPFWIPHWQPTNPDKCPHLNITGTPAELYGNNEDSQLLSNICGHNICLDRFGSCKPNDKPRTVHGEAPITLFNVYKNKDNKISFYAELPLARISIEREFEIDGDNINVSTTIEDMSNQDIRTDIEWCEHVTLGDPFINDITFEVNCDECYQSPINTEHNRFNNISTKFDKIDINKALSIPLSNNKNELIEEITCLRNNYNNNNNGYFIGINKKLGYKLQYNWNKYTFPWLCLWTEHYARKHKPWNGKERTRGMEFSTKPFPVCENEKILPENELSKGIDGVNIWRERNIDMVVKRKRTEEFSFKLSYL